MKFVFFFQFFGIALAIPVCIQIGDVRTILLDVPIRSEKTKITIKLSEEYDGLPLKVERIDKNHPAYLNPSIKPDDMWPCRLTGSKQIIEKTHLNSNTSADNLVMKNTPSSIDEVSTPDSVQQATKKSNVNRNINVSTVNDSHFGI